MSNINHLTQSLNINGYNIFVSQSNEDKEQQVRGIQAKFNSHQLTQQALLLAKVLGAQVLNMAHQEFQPAGASSMVLMGNALAHLDQSHISLHSYIDHDQYYETQIVRLDIDLATCGDIDALNVVDSVLQHYSFDVITLDYRVRGVQQVGSHSFEFGQSIHHIEPYLRHHDHYYSVYYENALPEIRSYYAVLRANPSRVEYTDKMADALNALLQGMC